MGAHNWPENPPPRNGSPARWPVRVVDESTALDGSLRSKTTTGMEREACADGVGALAAIAELLIMLPLDR